MRCRIYRTISQTWCAYHATHQAGLLLEQRLAKKQNAGKRKLLEPPENSGGNCFGVSLFRVMAPVKWLDTEFRILEPTAVISHSRRMTPTRAVEDMTLIYCK